MTALLLYATPMLLCGAATCFSAEQIPTLPSLSFDELKALSSELEPRQSLARKLDCLLDSVEVGSFANSKTGKPFRPVESGATILRAVMWNIERGQEFDQIATALKSPEQFRKLCEKRSLKPEQLKLIQEQADLRSHSDVVVAT